MRPGILIVVGVLVAIAVASCSGEKQTSSRHWGTYQDETYKFAVKFPPGWGVTVADRQYLEDAEGMQNAEAQFTFSDELASFAIVVYPNPQHLSAKQWFDKNVEEAGTSWGGRWSIIAEHDITVNGQKGYTALMELPDSKDKRTYFAWGERAYMIYYTQSWPLMTEDERKNYESRYATLESMLQTFGEIE